ncbi:MAG: DUF2339 domain-containing protein [Aphanocapsa sp. GSE-SYN-MK-11-07L]|jgi:hypothetical protein|nr:DUF2339 domain-containing protein [Aphanocapsa sp. GSE-SYN-MK-11-07L]
MQNGDRDQSLADRIERLEAAVADLQRLVKQLQAALLNREPNLQGQDLPPASTQSPLPSRPPVTSAGQLPASQPAPVKPTTPANFDWLQNWEFWLNRIGIGLLLLGVGFLFKYSIDQGWLTPAVRVGFGLALGIALLGMGLRLQSERRAFSQILMGGGIATFYISGFASFQLFKLVPYAVALVFMVAVTLLAFFLSLRQNQAVLSVLGAVGGLGTPFLLSTSSGSVSGLVGYTVLLLLGTSAIYWQQGWRSLLWTSFIGGWLIFAGSTLGLGSAGASPDHWPVQAGIMFGWIAFAGLPVLRLAARSPEGRGVADPAVEMIAVVTPLLVLGLSQQIWMLPDSTWGLLAMGAAIAYGGLGYGLRRSQPSLSETETLVCFLLLAIALVLLLSGNFLFLMLAAEAVGLHLLSKRLRNYRILVAAHLLSAAIAARLFDRLLTDPVKGLVVFNSAGLVDLAVIMAAAGLGLRVLAQPGLVYLVIAHVGFLTWLWRQLSALPDGSGYVTVAWGLYAIGLLVMGLRQDQQNLRVAGLATLGLVILKLFFWDLIGLAAIWRILLFMGFGAVLLGLSYSFRSLWKPGNPNKTDNP